MKLNIFILFLSLFTATNNVLLAQQSDAKMAERCRELRTGRFISTINNGETWIEVERKNGLQIEREDGNECTSSIRWRSDCSYEITIQSLPEGLSAEDLGKTFRVTIDKIEGNKYFYTFYNEKSEVEFSGYMKRLW